MERTLAVTWAVCVLGAFGACSDAAGTPAEGPQADAHRRVLAGVADGVILPELRSFAQAAAALAATDLSELDAAQAVWRTAMGHWQQLEVLQVGPAGLMGDVAGGQSLRDAIYSWPTVNPCRVDQVTARQGYDGDLTQALPNERGLDALEYLLFTEDAGHQCSAGSQFALGGEWEAIGDAASVAARRQAHAAALAQDLSASAAQLLAAWEPAQGNFRDALALAGAGSSVYATAQEALNALSDALFYAETETKDMKLSVPAGISAACGSDTCPEALESRWAHRSKAHIVANLRGFNAAFTGDEGVGFDDLLSDIGQGALATQFVGCMDEAIAAVEALPGPLVDTLASARADIEAAYDGVSACFTLLKTQILSVLDLELPQRVEGDND